MIKKKSSDTDSRRKFIKTGARYVLLGGFTLLGLNYGFKEADGGDKSLSPFPFSQCKNCGKQSNCPILSRRPSSESAKKPENCPEIITRKKKDGQG